MKFYALSLATGILVGVIYSLLQVRSPAPPLIALLGLLGMLAGEQIIPTGKQLLNTWRFSEQKAHMVIQGDATSICNQPKQTKENGSSDFGVG